LKSAMWVLIGSAGAINAVRNDWCDRSCVQFFV
jgi:hypothetical protein